MSEKKEKKLNRMKRNEAESNTVKLRKPSFHEMVNAEDLAAMRKQKKKVGLKDAIQLINSAFNNDPRVTGRDVISIGTLYNAIHSGKIKAYGPRHFRQVDIDEVLSIYNPKRSA
jgi:hypothetical protein